jgi:hypothetical protein
MLVLVVVVVAVIAGATASTGSGSHGLLMEHAEVPAGLAAAVDVAGSFACQSIDMCSFAKASVMLSSCRVMVRGLGAG